MAAAAGIWSHHAATGQTLADKATPMTGPASGTSGSGSTSSTSSSSSSSATISANDFLTLLVTEMQNQDPTADTDPNEYINQLVQVNSLEQLIDINQNVSTALGDSTTSTSTTSSDSASAGSGTAGAAVAKPTGKGATGASALSTARQAASSATTAAGHTAPAAASRRAPGNLSVPEAKPASRTVAEALSGQSRTR
jgi:flagellar basal-body rod modification protein FlgD